MPDTQSAITSDNSSILSALGDVDKMLAGSVKSEQEAVKSTTERIRKRDQEIETSLDKLSREKFDQAPPKFTGIEKPPEKPNWEPLKAFGSFASAFGVMASLLTKAPLESALNASAAAMNALRRNDEEGYAQAYNAWRQNSQYAIDRAKMEQDQYKEAFNMFRQSHADALADLQAKAAINRDDTMALMIQTGEEKNIIQLYDARQRLLEKAQEHHDSLEMQAKKLEQTFKLAAPDRVAAMRHMDENPNESADDFAKWVQSQKGGGDLTDESANLIAQEVLAGNRGAAAGLARSAKNIAKVNNAIAEEAKKQGLSGAEIAARQAEFQGATQGMRTLNIRDANMSVAANEVEQMAPLALDASKKIDRTEFKDLNAIIQAAERGTGDENIITFGLAANSLIYIYAKFLNPNGIPTDADKARATEILSTAWAEGQFEAAIAQMKREIAAGKAGVAKAKADLSSSVTGVRGKYKVGDVITKGAKKYRVTGGDMNDPDVEEVQ